MNINSYGTGKIQSPPLPPQVNYTAAGKSGLESSVERLEGSIELLDAGLGSLYSRLAAVLAQPPPLDPSNPTGHIEREVPGSSLIVEKLHQFALRIALMTASLDAVQQRLEV